MAEWGIIRASWLIPRIESSTRFFTHDSNREFVLRELYNKCTRDTDRWTAICEDYQEQIDETLSSVIRQSFQTISNVPSKTLDDALIKKTTERRFNDGSQHYNPSKNTYIRINYILVDTCHCEQYLYIRFYVILDLWLMNITPSIIVRSEICGKLEQLSLYKVRIVETLICASLSLILANTEIDNSFIGDFNHLQVLRVLNIFMIFGELLRQ